MHLLPELTKTQNYDKSFTSRRRVCKIYFPYQLRQSNRDSLCFFSLLSCKWERESAVVIATKRLAGVALLSEAYIAYRQRNVQTAGSIKALKLNEDVTRSPERNISVVQTVRPKSRALQLHETYFLFPESIFNNDQQNKV